MQICVDQVTSCRVQVCGNSGLLPIVFSVCSKGCRLVRRLWKPDISLNRQGAGSYISGVELHRREAAMAARNLELDLHYVRVSFSGPISSTWSRVDSQ